MKGWYFYPIIDRWERCWRCNGTGAADGILVVGTVRCPECGQPKPPMDEFFERANGPRLPYGPEPEYDREGTK